LAIIVAADASRFDELQRAAQALTEGKREADEDGSVSLRLLADVRSVWPGNERHILSADLINRLNGRDESPWAAEVGLDQRKLARMLKPYGAHTKTVRTRGGRARGYERDDLEDAFARYLRPEA